MHRALRHILIAAVLVVQGPSARAADDLDTVQASTRHKDKRVWFGQVEFHLSLLTDTNDRSTLSMTLGPAVKIGRRFGDWGAFVALEYNAWRATDFGNTWQPGAFNIGFGGEYIYAGGLVRASLAVGPSILLWDTILDDAGSVGVFAELKPAGIRWEMNDWFVLMFDPASVAMVAPVLGDPALILIEYRATFTTEFRW